MKRASLLFVTLLLTSFIASVTTHAQSEVISERVQRTLTRYNRLDVADLLRLYPSEEYSTEIVTLSLVAQSYMGPGQITLLSYGRVMDSVTVRGFENVQFYITSRESLAGLEIVADRGEVFIESITARIQRSRIERYPTPRYPSPRPPTDYRPVPRDGGYYPAPRPAPRPRGPRPR